MAEKLYNPDRPSPKTLDDQRRWSQSEFDKLSLAIEKVSTRIEAVYRPPVLSDFGAYTTQEKGDSFDASDGILRAIDYMGRAGTNLGRGGTLLAQQGNFRVSKPLRPRPHIKLKGEGGGNASTFNFYNTGSETPFAFDGNYGASDGTLFWVWDIEIEDMLFDFSACPSAADQMVDIEGAYSCDFSRWTLGDCPTGKTPLRVGRSNHLSFFKQRINGNQSRPQSILVDPTYGEINLLVFNTPDMEVAEIGINCINSSSYRTLIDVMNPYSEALGTVVKWDAGGSSGSPSESRLLVCGGNAFGRDSSSIGIDIRRSNAMVMGYSMGSVGAIGVDIDNATSHDNCHVIGGNLHVTTPVRDTNNWLASNSYKGSWAPQ